MKVLVTEDIQLRDEIRGKIKANDGYCPCAILKVDDTKCMCKDFRDKLHDPSYEGPCHCGLYIKKK